MVRFVSIYVGKFESHCPRARERPGLANIDGLLICVRCLTVFPTHILSLGRRTLILAERKRTV